MGFNIPMGVGSALSGAAGAYNDYAVEERRFQKQKSLEEMAFNNALKREKELAQFRYDQEQKLLDWKKEQEKLHRKAQVEEHKYVWEQDNDIVDDETREYRKWTLDLLPIYGEKTNEVVNEYLRNKKIRKDFDAQAEYIDKINTALSFASDEDKRDPIWQADTKRFARQGLKIKNLDLLNKVDDAYFPKLDKEFKEDSQKYTLENANTGETKLVSVKAGQTILTPEMKTQGWRMSTINPEYKQFVATDANGNLVMVGSRTGEATVTPNPGTGQLGPKTAPTMPAEMVTKKQQFNTANDILEEIEESFKPEYVGVVNSWLGKASDKLDIKGQEDRAYFRKMIGKLFNNLVYMRSGKQINEEEGRRLADEFMSKHPSLTEYKAGIRALKFELKSIGKNLDREIAAAGYNQKGTAKLTPEQEAEQYLKGK